MVQRGSNGHQADQAARLRQLARKRVCVGEKKRRAKSIAIASGKGGVGKTNVAVNLSICLAARGLRVTLVDADMGLANADLLMNIRTRYSLGHVLSGLRTVEEICTDGPGGIRFIAGASGIDALANMSDLERAGLLSQLERLEDSADIVVLDCGAGISRNVIGFACSADEALIITTPEPTAMTDAYATIKVMVGKGCAGRLALFVNMAENRDQAQAVYKRISEVARRFLNYSVADAGYMLHDTCVASAVQQRLPVVIRYPRSNASACIASMARQFAGTTGGRRDRGGFFERVIGLFV